MTFDREAYLNKVLAYSVDRLELPECMFRALDRLKRKTVRGLTNLRECDIMDALDEDPSLDERSKRAAVETTFFILNEMSLSLQNGEGRFESFAELRRWVLEVATEHNLDAHQEELVDGEPAIILHLRKSKGSVRLRSLGREPFKEVYDANFTTRKAEDRGMVIVRAALRHAQQLAAQA